MSKILFKEDSL
jgi:aminopeptidase N